MRMRVHGCTIPLQERAPHPCPLPSLPGRRRRWPELQSFIAKADAYKHVLTVRGEEGARAGAALRAQARTQSRSDRSDRVHSLMARSGAKSV
jgi:hypothetical protein